MKITVRYERYGLIFDPPTLTMEEAEEWSGLPDYFIEDELGDAPIETYRLLAFVSDGGLSYDPDRERRYDASVEAYYRAVQEERREEERWRREGPIPTLERKTDDDPARIQREEQCEHIVNTLTRQIPDADVVVVLVNGDMPQAWAKRGMKVVFADLAELRDQLGAGRFTLTFLQELATEGRVCIDAADGVERA